jgi:hypothetical protein
VAAFVSQLQNKTVTRNLRFYHHHHLPFCNYYPPVSLKRGKRGTTTGVVGVVFDAGGAVSIQRHVLVDHTTPFAAAAAVVVVAAAGVLSVQYQPSTTPRTVAACEAVEP